MEQCVDCDNPLGTNYNCEWCCKHWALQKSPEQVEAEEAANYSSYVENGGGTANPYAFDDSVYDEEDAPMPQNDAAMLNGSDTGISGTSADDNVVTDTVAKAIDLSETFAAVNELNATLADATVADEPIADETVADATIANANDAEATCRGMSPGRTGECVPEIDVQGNVQLKHVQGNVASEFGLVFDQESFDASFYTALQIIEIIGISRHSFYARVKNGYLGEPIKLFPNLLIWARTPELESKVETWRVNYGVRMHRMGRK